MFKCCVCNGASKKVNNGTGTKSPVLDGGTPAAVESPKLITGTTIVIEDDRNHERADDQTSAGTIADDEAPRSNGDVPRAEETASSTAASTPDDVTASIRADSATTRAETEDEQVEDDAIDVDVDDVKSDSDSVTKGAEEEEEERETADSPVAVVAIVVVDDGVDDRVDDRVDGRLDDRADVEVDGSHLPMDESVVERAAEDVVVVAAAAAAAAASGAGFNASSPAKINLYNATGYIERTIDDGPEDEGDDSVFEACPSENDNADTDKKTSLVAPLPRWLSEEDDDGEHVAGGCSGVQEPPATPVARDELALRRHRFFSELLQAAHNSTEHRVRFDPLGPRVHIGCGEIGDREEYLEQLVNRLENVTTRLEKVPVHSAIQTQDTAVQTNTPSPKKRTSSESNRSESSSSREDTSVSSILSLKQQTIPNQPTNMSVAGYEDLLCGPVKEYLALSQKIGGDVAIHSKLVEKAFQIQFQFVQTAASRPAPQSQSEQVSLLGPMSMQIQQIQDFREKNRGSPFFNHLSAISESIPALGWVAVSPTPAPYVKEMNDAGQFYTNRVLKDWKEKNKIHIDWCKAWVQTLTDLQQYVRQHHTTGLVWAKTGTAPIGIPPPPPPSMPIGDVAPLAINDDRSALFAQINQGEDITKSLKKVTSEMQTHKNPSLRSGPAPFKAPVVSNATPMKNVLPANAPIDKPPSLTRDGKKWLVEYFKGESLVIDSAEMNHVIYMFRCQDSTLTVEGKINSIVMDSCRKSSVVFNSLVSSIEFINCQSVQMQVLGKVPTISIDKTDGCQMYLNTDSLDVELITSKSSEMNVMVPKGNGDYAEYPVPEQFKTTISRNGLNTMAVDSLG